jgi:hypothetical protein
MNGVARPSHGTREQAGGAEGYHAYSASHGELAGLPAERPPSPGAIANTLVSTEGHDHELI